MSKLKKGLKQLTHGNNAKDIIATFCHNPYIAYKYYIEHAFRYCLYKGFHKAIRNKHYAGGIVLHQDIGNELLYKAIIEGKPFMAGRLGGSELAVMAGVITADESKLDKLNLQYLKECSLSTGFFSQGREADFRKFTQLMLRSMKSCDLIGVWYKCMEDYICKKHLHPSAKMSHIWIFDFWRYEKPFSYALKGKKVLVVHPFDESIKRQYFKKDKLFENNKILPYFELITYRAVQTIAGTVDSRFKDWFEALDFMYNEIIKLDFDIVILGCGAYGFPLAAQLKQAGKVAIHMGGVTQMLFGIKGNRWNHEPDAYKLYKNNPYWVKPSRTETPKSAETVEEACYW